MSDHATSLFLPSMTRRAAGKRQIKPTAILFESVPVDEEEEDDDDFTIQSDKEKSESGSSSSENSSDDDEEEQENDNEDAATGGTKAEETKGPHACAVCLNLRQAVKEEDVMQCDKCGLTVHEACYGGIFDDDSEKESISDSSTSEAWFCEPCLYGLKEPPFCELCPNRYGAFKRSDIGGRWVHLICALYTSGISFAAVDSLTGVSWQEIDSARFGRKACNACDDKIEARTGVTTRCESGLCKEHFHPTCAQRLGVLVDKTDETTTSNAEVACLNRFLFCKKHANQDESKTMRAAYEKWDRQEGLRISMARRRPELSVSEENKRKEEHAKMEKLFASLINVTICYPNENADKNRRARLLHTSPQFLELFKEKAELVGVSNDTFRKPFLNIDVSGIPYMPPGYSQEYFAYVNYRDTVSIPEEERKIEKLTGSIEQLNAKKQKNEGSEELREKAVEARAKLNEKKQLLDRFYKALLKFDGKVDRPSLLEAPVVEDKSKNNSKARTQNGQQNGRQRVRKSDEENAHSSNSLSHIMTTRTCSECSLKKDQHKITTCDECHRHYHIHCLVPPLERLPKRTANIGWMCHNCDEDDDVKHELPPALEPEDGRIATRSSRRSTKGRAPKRHLDADEEYEIEL